jgi:hypothetical protein
MRRRLTISDRFPPNPRALCDFGGARLAATLHDQIIVDRIRDHQFLNNVLQECQRPSRAKAMTGAASATIIHLHLV